MTQDHPGPGAVRGLQQRDGEWVDLPAHVDAADAFTVDDQVGVLETLGGRGRRFLRANPAQAGPGGGQLVGVRLGCLLAVQQRVGDLVDPVLVPARDVSPRVQHRAVVAAQRRPVDDDHLHPIQTPQGSGVEDHLPGVGEPAAQDGGEGLPPDVRRPGHAGQQCAGGVFGPAPGQQCARRGDQRRVRGLVGVLLHGPGHGALGGVDGGVDGAADHHVRDLARGGGGRIVPRRLGFGSGRRDDGHHRGLRPLRCGQLGLAFPPALAVGRGFGDLEAALRQIQQRGADRLRQPVGQGGGGAERDVGADPAQPRLQHADDPGLMIQQRGRGAGAARCDGQPSHPTGHRDTDRRDIHGRRGEGNQDRQGVTRVREWRGPRRRLRSHQRQVGGDLTDRFLDLVQDGVGVGVAVEFDHQPAQRTLDVRRGDARDPAHGFLHRGRVLVPGGERQQGIQVQVHSPAALPANRRRDTGRRRTAHPDCPARRLRHRLHHRAGQIRHRAGQRLHGACGPRRGGHTGSHQLRCPAGHTSNDAGHARNLHSVTLRLRPPRLMILACQGPVHMRVQG